MGALENGGLKKNLSVKTNKAFGDFHQADFLITWFNWVGLQLVSILLNWQKPVAQQNDH